MNWLQLVKLIVPIALATNPKTAKYAPYVTEGIEEAEQIPGLHGQDKARKAKDVAVTLIKARNAQAGRVVIDPDDADGAISSGIDTGVAVVNIIHKANPVPPT